VEFFNTLREKVNGLKYVEMENVNTLRDVLTKLDEMFPNLKEEIWDGENLNEEYLIMINGRNIAFLGGVDAKLSDGDEVSMFPPAAGG